MSNYTQAGYDPSLHGFWKGTADDAPNFGYPQNYFYADTMRSLFIGFENFFNELKVIRYNKFGEPVKTIDVPIKFGPRNKSHDFRTEQESGKKYYISLPNLVYRLDSMQFASERAKGIYETRAFYNKDLENAGLVCDQQEKFWSDVQPVPYNISVSMEANCEKMTDAEQIVEQIAVRFQPAAFFDVKEFWFFNKRRSIKMKLESMNWEIQSESMGEEEWRQIKVSFTFTMEAFLYKPIKDAQIIEKINTYITLNRGDYLYHAATFGNKDGSLTNPYKFSKIYQTKVGPTYVLNGSPKTVLIPSSISGIPTSAYVTTYQYRETDDLTTYDEDAKLLTAVSSIWIPETVTASGASMLHHRPVTAHSGDYLCSIDGVPVYAKHDGELSGYIDDVSTDYTNEWLTLKSYSSLSGFGHNNDQTISFGSKTLRDQYNNPYSAYYSQFTEEGTYTSDEKEYKEGDYDYYYKVTKQGLKPKIDFDGSKYNVSK